MNKVVKGVSILFVAILLAMFAQLYLSRRAGAATEAAAPPAWHMQIVCTDLDSGYFAEFMEGARQAQAENDVFVEFVETDKWDAQGVYRAVEMGVDAGVDGIAFQASDPGLIGDLMAYAAERGTQLMLYESENHQNMPILSAGSDSYQIGYQAGQLALEAAGGPCRAVVVVDSTQLGEASAQGSLKLRGLEDAFADSGLGEIVDAFPLDSQAMSGEVLVNTLLESRGSYDTIISLSERTTPLVGQRLLYHGYFREITLIGYGFPNAQILDHIDRGITYAVICPDARDVGYHTVALMVDALAGRPVQDYSSASTYVISRRNIIDYLLEPEGEA